ncbi:MAG: dockerin type I domain-containing protein, partial [Pirellulales bacterium]
MFKKLFQRQRNRGGRSRWRGATAAHRSNVASAQTRNLTQRFETLEPRLLLSASADFNGNFLLDVGDIDLLRQEIQAGSNGATFDLTQDGAVDFSDLENFVTQKFRTFFGDVNLDARVDRSDLAQLQRGLGTEGGVSWADGDLDGDDRVTTSDLARLSA